ncbi:MAG: hypothetical protein FWD79_03770 [Desulfobulbus sp.]|nr:hypothetical protein [Desulfobulbus sp.]
MKEVNAHAAKEHNDCVENTWGALPDLPIPIQIVDESESGSRRIAASIAEVRDRCSYSHTLATAVVKHIAIWLERNNLRIDNENKESLLQFVMWPLANRKDDPFAPMPSLDVRSPSSSGGFRLSSPWVELIFERAPVLRLRGVIRWNERQLLVDQAILAGAHNVPAGVAMPLQKSEFMPGTLEYSRDPEELERFARGCDDFRERYNAKVKFDDLQEQYMTKSKSKEEIYSIWIKRIEETEDRIPADLLWLFRRSPRNDRNGPFVLNVYEAMETVRKKSAENYTKLVIALIDHCLASEGTTLHYSNILDVADLIPLDQYKIDTLTKD